MLLDAEDIELSLEREAGTPPSTAPLLVGFGRVHVLDQKATEQTGTEQYREKIFVSIKIPGDPRFHYLQPAKLPDDAKKWPEAWRRFETGEAAGGTPLTAWSGISRSLAKTLRAKGIHTLETLASIQDANLERQGVIGLRALRDKAREQLSSTQNAAKAAAEADEKAALQAQLADMAEQMAAMQAELAKRGRGRPQSNGGTHAD